MRILKRTFILYFVLIFVILQQGCGNSGNAGTGNSNFEGLVTYDLDLNGGPPQAAQMLKGTTMKIYIKGDMSKSVSNVANMSSTTIISDTKKPDDPIMLLGIMGRKYHIILTDSMKKEAENNKPSIEYIDSSKQLAGYACKKARLVFTVPSSGAKISTYVYYTTDLPAIDPQGGQFKGLKGFPMEFTLNMSGINVKISVASVVKQSVPDSVFATPSGYRDVTVKEMMSEVMAGINTNNRGNAGNNSPAPGTK